MIESWVFEIFSIIITLASLFADDLKLYLLPLVLDNIYYALVLINIMLFTFEITVTSIGWKGYFLSFYFFTDIIATLTLFLDLGWLFHAIAGTRDFKGKEAVDIYNFAIKGENLKKGTRAAQVIRIIRLIKLLRIIKLYKHLHKIMNELQEWRDRKKNELKRKREAQLAQHGLAGAEKNEDSKVGKRLSDLTTWWVIILVLIMLCSVPIFSVTTYKKENEYFIYGP